MATGVGEFISNENGVAGSTVDGHEAGGDGEESTAVSKKLLYVR
jgi:hypothetical protein